jgi:lysozyme family protein
VEPSKLSDNDSFSIFPNPFFETCSLELPATAERVEIYNALGDKVDMIVYPFIWKPSSKLSDGVYIFKAFVGSQILMTKGFLIR